MTVKRCFALLHGTLFHLHQHSASSNKTLFSILFPKSILPTQKFNSRSSIHGSQKEIHLSLCLSKRKLNLTVVTTFPWGILPNISDAFSAEGLQLQRYTDSKDGFTILIPSSWKKVDKAEATALFQEADMGSNNIGVVVNPVRLASLGEFGSPQIVADKLLQAERLDDAVVDKNPGGSTESYSASPTFFSWITSWWPFRRSSGKSDDFTVHQEKVVSHSEEPKLSKLDQAIGHSGKLELFSRESFWSEMESFVFTPKESLLFSRSRSREEITCKLQKDGPVVLRSLSESDILQLVDLLITEKKWLEESPSQALPFELTQPDQNSSLLGQSHSANGLRSLFLSETSQRSLQSSRPDVEKQNQTIPHAGVSLPPSKGKYTKRSRSDILIDYQRLVNEILREHPEGYNIGSFRKLFFQGHLHQCQRLHLVFVYGKYRAYRPL